MLTITDRVLNEIDFWLEENGFDIVCSYGAELEYQAYVSSKNEIHFPEVYTDDEDLDKYFIRFLKLNGLKGHFNGLTLSILHEIGHGETFKQIPSKDIRRSFKITENLKIKSFEDYYIYWEAPVELQANLWLIDYVKSHKKEVQDLENILIRYLNI